MHPLWNSKKTIAVPIGDRDPSDVATRSLMGSDLGVVAEPGRDCDSQLVMGSWDVQQAQVVKRKKQKFHKSMRVHRLYPDLYTLLRAIRHAQHDYVAPGGELPRFVKVEQVLFRLNTLLTQLRKENLHQCIDELQHYVAESLAVLTPRVVLVEKVEARQYVLHIRNVYDSLNRVNPSKLLAELVAARRRVDLRQAGVQSITEHFAVREQVVLLTITYLETQVRVAVDFLQQLLERWQLNVSGHPQLLAEELQQTAALFQEYRIAPFAATFSYVADEYIRAATALAAGHFAEAKRLLEISLASLQLRQWRTDAERTVSMVSAAMHRDERVNTQVVVDSIIDSNARLSRIPCDGMRGFSKPDVQTNLGVALAFFAQTVSSQKACKQGYKALHTAVTAV